MPTRPLLKDGRGKKAKLCLQRYYQDQDGSLDAVREVMKYTEAGFNTVRDWLSDRYAPAGLKIILLEGFLAEKKVFNPKTISYRSAFVGFLYDVISTKKATIEQVAEICELSRDKILNWLFIRTNPALSADYQQTLIEKVLLVLQSETVAAEPVSSVASADTDPEIEAFVTMLKFVNGYVELFHQRMVEIGQREKLRQAAGPLLLDVTHGIGSLCNETNYRRREQQGG